MAAQDGGTATPVPSRFGVLGPLEVVVGGERVAVRGARRVALLSRLLMSANRTVAAERLIDDVWGEPSSAGNAKGLASLVWLLRTQLGVGRLLTRAGGYQLAVAAGELDAGAFESDLAAGHDAVRRGDMTQAVALFEQSVTRWRGRPFVEVEDAPWARAEAGRLEELRLGAHEALLDVRLSLGQHRLAVPAAEAAVHDEPLRERRWATLLLALYRCGRQAEALRAFQRLRALLREELGIEPSPDLVALEEAIVLQKPELDWSPGPGDPSGSTTSGARVASHEPPPGTAPGEVPLPSPLLLGPSAGLVGRHREMALLRRVLADVSGGGGPQVVLLSGESGIGKSALAAELGRAAFEAGACVLWGGCDEDIRAPFIPFSEILGHFVRHTSEELLASHVAVHGGELGLLVPALRERLGTLPPPRSVDPETERYLVLGAATALLGAASASQPVVLVIDDLHWADRATLRLLRHLVSSALPQRLLVVATCRDAGNRGPHPPEEALAALQLEDGVTRVALGGLTESDVHASLERAVGHPLGEAGARWARTLCRQCGGNPFFLTEVVRHLIETDALLPGDDNRWAPAVELADYGLPDGVRRVIASRVARLGDEATRVLTAAAVLGIEFDLAVVAPMVGLDEDLVLDVLDASGGAALTIEVTGHPGRFRFAHALVQHALYDGLGDARRVRAHRRAAQVMGAVSDAALDDRTPALARHWLAAGPADSATAARFARRAGDRALRILAPTQAIRWYEEALCALARAPHDGERARCLVGMGEAQVQVGDPARWDTLAEAARLARRTGDSRLLVRVALVDHHFFSINIGQPDGERISTLEAALAALEVLEAPSAQDTAARVGLLLRLAVERSGDGDHVGRRHLADEALRRARRMGDPLTLLQALIAHSAIVAGTDAGELRRQFHEIDDLAGRIDDPAWKFWSAVRCGATSLLLGDGRGVRRHIGHASALAATVGNPSFRRAAALHHGWVALLAGRPHDAERLANEMLQIGLDTGEPDVTTVYAGQLFAIRWHQGRLGQMLGPLEQLAEANRDVPAVRAATALALVEGARDEEAGALLASEVASGFVAPEDWLRSTYLAHWADVAEHLAHADAAALLYELLAPHPAQVAFTGGTTHGAQAHPLGALAAVLGRVEEAHHHFALALDIHERLEAPFHIARTSLAWARLLLEHGDDHHVSRARDLLTRSAALADRHGYAVVGRRAAAALGRLEVGDHRPRAGAAAAR